MYLVSIRHLLIKYDGYIGRRMLGMELPGKRKREGLKLGLWTR